jgi:hypothetical protein
MTTATATLSASSVHGRFRGVGAVLAGLAANVLFATLTDMVMHGLDIFPPVGEPMVDPLFVLALTYRIVYGVAAGYLTAALAPTRPVRYALILGVIGTVLGILGTIAVIASGTDGGGPLWYPLAVVAVAIPTTLAGARLRAKR